MGKKTDFGTVAYQNLLTGLPKQAQYIDVHVSPYRRLSNHKRQANR